MKKRKLFRPGWPNLCHVPDGDIEVKGLNDLRDILCSMEDLHIVKRRYHDPEWGIYYNVKAVALPFYAPGTYYTIGRTNFYEDDDGVKR